MTQKNRRFSVNPDYERILLKILTVDDNEPLHYELLGELARTQYSSDMTNKGALNTLTRSMHFKCLQHGFYCLAGSY